jgi:DNA-binding transcriptional MerR regulator
MGESADIMHTFTVGELARRTAVTVRTLHHYESLGLLAPSARTQAGHRRYGAADVIRLRRIVTLRELGVPLREIASLLDAASGGLLDALRAHRRTLIDRRAEIDAAIERIDALERNVREHDEPTRGELESLMETIAMEKNVECGRRYLTEVRGMTAAEADEQMRATPPEAAEGQRKWGALIADVENAIAEGVEPTSARGAELFERWQALIAGFTGGDPAKLAEIRTFYAELPAGFPRPYGDDVEAFIHAAGSCA